MSSIQHPIPDVNGKIPCRGVNKVHDPNCAVCGVKLREGERLYGAKNAETREYRCIVAANSEQAREKVGWNGATLYVMRVRSYQPPMSEAVKAKLRQIQAERKSVSGPNRRNWGKPQKEGEKCIGSIPNGLHGHDGG